MNLPEKLPESSDLRHRMLYNVINRIIDYLASVTPQFGGNSKLQRTPTGFTYINPPGGAAGTTLQVCAVTSLSNEDYIGVTPYDIESGDLTGSEFQCAKCLTGRMPDSENIDGNVITYEYGLLPNGQYGGDNLRMATWPDSTTTYQVMHLRYIRQSDLTEDSDNAQCAILVSKVNGPTGVQDESGNDIAYLEIGSRDWAFSPSLNYVL